MTREEKQEGLVLKGLDYQDRKKIITLFTKDKGVVSLIVSGLHRKASHLLTLTSPLTVGEYHYRVGRSTLYRFLDGTPLETNSTIRQTLPHIETATAILHSLLVTQLPEKPAPLLYSLTRAYLRHLPTFANPAPLLLSFQLKLLTHEGLINLSPHCTHCEKPTTHLAFGAPYCRQHKPPCSIELTPQEWTQLHTLQTAKKFTEIAELPVHPEVQQMLQEICERGESNPHEVTLTTPSR